MSSLQFTQFRLSDRHSNLSRLLWDMLLGNREFELLSVNIYHSLYYV